jgi:hypothetical protein
MARDGPHGLDPVRAVDTQAVARFSATTNASTSTRPSERPIGSSRRPTRADSELAIADGPGVQVHRVDHHRRAAPGLGHYRSGRDPRHVRPAKPNVRVAPQCAERDPTTDRLGRWPRASPRRGHEVADLVAPGVIGSQSTGERRPIESRGLDPERARRPTPSVAGNERASPSTDPTFVNARSSTFTRMSARCRHRAGDEIPRQLDRDCAPATGRSAERTVDRPRSPPNPTDLGDGRPGGRGSRAPSRSTGCPMRPCPSSVDGGAPDPASRPGRAASLSSRRRRWAG